jgi:AraC-like DNA-binding protein
MIVLNPEEAHSGGPPAAASWTYRALYLRPELLDQIRTELPGDRPTRPEFREAVVRDREVAARFHRFHRLSERPGSSLLERESHLTEALVVLVGRHGAPTQEPRSPGQERRAVRLSREYLDEHAEEDVPLGSLAGFAGLSPYHLCRVFRNGVGMTPHDYQTQVRVRRAKTLLSAGLPIALVAAEAGFYDQAHLTRQFKRIVGLTPGRYIRDAVN